MFGAGLPTGGHRRVRPGRITALRACGCRTVELFPFSGRGAGLRFCSLWPHSSRKWWGFPKGAVPFGTRLLERSGKSLVCYTFCPGWRGKGDGRQDSRFAVPGKQAEEWSDSNHSSACFQEGQKVYTAPVPRPSSRRSEINVTTCAANRPVRPAPYSAPASPSDGSAPQSLG